ncbi:alpha-N-arabinofuranosidase [Phototrophicus methaneseepsis]|uniref:non-reducing end alpha-L-arabinofuranosidase n=1 Tax=Phototrophicus methaneseepsis TaxID=2710758 RepID=A0A7S8ID86_9CHLR|nr:alpha-L-arabinofuranosidase C-terminal domain-containing protein [Phototrophicus methaneseepsis]QPC81312.1 alpha-N-arabinofuranosidase [Phototrophicus methaneseepsis]
MPEHHISVNLQHAVGQINPNIYGHFAEHLGACIYEGIWVGEDSPIPNTNGMRNDVIAAMKKIAPPVIRWPGGCFADDYHWRDGIGPRDSRPDRINIWWGEDIENNHFGTHEFLQFCRLVGAEPYLVGNVGSGTPGELRDWVEYCNFAGDSTLSRERAANGSPEPFGVRYWGVGNENWGCGGSFDPEDYAAAYRQFSTYLREFGQTPLYLIACGPRNNDIDWTLRFLEKLKPAWRPKIHGFAAHYYARARDPQGRESYSAFTGTATDYTDAQWYYQIYVGLEMERLVMQQRAAMDSYDPDRQIGLIVDEWGTWHPPTEGHHPRHLWQQNTIRDALVAATTLDIFNRHADKVVMGNIAQTINVLQAMILTDGDQMLTTPTYHVYDMYQAHQGGQSILLQVDSDVIPFEINGKQYDLPALSGSASLKGRTLTLSIVNSHIDQPIETTIDLGGIKIKQAELSTLVGEDIYSHNTFAAPSQVEPRLTSLDVPDGEWVHTFEPASVNVITFTL